MDDVLASLQAQVAQTNTTIGSAIIFINGLEGQIRAAGTDPAKLQAIADSLKNNTDALAAAIVTPPQGSTDSGNATDGGSTAGTTGTADTTPTDSGSAASTDAGTTPVVDNGANPVPGI